MKILSLASIFILLLSAVALVAVDSAEAARMGGGRSFGSRPSMSQPARTPINNQQSRMGNAANTTGQRSGMLGGMGGLMGGLLAGTLLGSLLGGHGFSGGGFMDLILLAILAYLGYKLFMRFRNRQASTQTAGQGGGMPFGANSGFSNPNVMQRQGTGSMWGSFNQNQSGPAQAYPQVDIPADFDTADFLKGAKAAYVRMQQSWDRRDLADISNFATPAILSVLEDQRRAEPNPTRTEILSVNASVVGVEDEGTERRAQVFFDVMMREDPSSPTPENVQEIWHFVRQNPNGSWMLDGIQQVR